MKRLLCTTTILFFLSCGQIYDTPDPIDPVLSPTQTALMKHTWIFDSVYWINAGKTEVYAEPKDKVTFTANSYSVTYNGSSGKSLYEVGDSAKIYWWAEGGQKDNTQYDVLTQLTDTSLIMYEGPPKFLPSISYHHAE